MIAIRHVLVPTDFGEAAGTALEYALALAKKFDARVTLLHAFAFPVTDYGDVVQWPIAEIEVQAQKALDEALATAKKEYASIDGLVVCGETYRQILDVAAARKCDLIVLGTHGRRGLSRLLLGSVAEKVVRLSPVPVLTVSAPKVAAEKAAD